MTWMGNDNNYDYKLKFRDTLNYFMQVIYNLKMLHFFKTK